MEYKTLPVGWILNKTLGMIILWKCPSFSFRKNKSGFQIFSGSVRVKNRIWPCLSSYCSLSSVHSSRNVNCVEYSCWIRDKERMFKGWENIKFHEEKERVVREIKMKETEISFETKYVCNRRLYIALTSTWSKFHSLVLQRPPQDINRTEYRKWSYTFLWHDLQIKLCPQSLLYKLDMKRGRKLNTDFHSL